MEYTKEELEALNYLKDRLPTIYGIITGLLDKNAGLHYERPFSKPTDNFMKRQEIIQKHLGGWSHDDLRSASIEYYAKSGKISGSLSMALRKAMDDYAIEFLSWAAKENHILFNVMQTDAPNSIDDLYSLFERAQFEVKL